MLRGVKLIKRTLIFSIIAISTLSAQSFWGIKAGYAVSKLRDSKVAAEYGYSFGISRSIHMKKNFYLDIELNITQKKSDYGQVTVLNKFFDLPNNYVSLADINLEPKIIEIPILAKYKFAIWNKYYFASYAGFAISYALIGNTENQMLKELSEPGIIIDHEYTFIEEGNFSYSHFVYSFNVGLNVFLYRRIWLDIRYGTDLSANGSIDGFLVNSTFHSLYLLVGFRF